MQNMITMVIVSDMDRSVKFYRDTLGLKLRFQSPDWSEFDLGTTTLALHGGGKPAPPRLGPPESIAGTASIGFTVDNIDSAYEDLKSRGARFVMPPKTQEAEGIRLAVMVDPDGLSVSIAQTLR
jgi:lactoylglutathione lyase